MRPSRFRNRVVPVYIAIIIMLSTVLVITSDTRGLPSTNISVDDRTLCNYTFETYPLGADPSSYPPQILTRSTAAAQGSTVAVSTNPSGGRQLSFTKHTADALAPGWSLSLPTNYINYSISYEWEVHGCAIAWGGWEFDLYSGSTGYGYITAQTRITNYPLGTWLFRVYNTSAEYMDLGTLDEDTRYVTTFSVHDATATYDLKIEELGGDVLLNLTFPYYTYNGRDAGRSGTLSFIAKNAEYGSTLYVDNIKATVEERLVDTAPYETDGKSFSFIFDDVPEGVYTYGYPVLAARGCVGVAGVTVDKVGTAGHMSWEQLQTLADAGWEMAGHGVTHTSLTTMTWEDATAEILNTKAYIEANLTGVAVTTFAAPYNSWNITLENFTRSVGYTATPYSYQRDYYGYDSLSLVYKALNKTSQLLGNAQIFWAHNISQDYESRYSDDIFDTELDAFINLTEEYGYGAWDTVQDVFGYAFDRNLFSPEDLVISASSVSFTNNMLTSMWVVLNARCVDEWTNGYWQATNTSGPLPFSSCEYPDPEDPVVLVAPGETISMQLLLRVEGTATVTLTEYDTSDMTSMTFLANATNEVTFVVCGLDVNASYSVVVDNETYIQAISSDADGSLTFDYDDWSEHEFSIEPSYIRQVSVMFNAIVGVVLVIAIMVAMVGVVAGASRKK